MKRMCVIAAALCTIAVSIFSQDSDPAVLAFQRDFARGDLAAKLAAVDSASKTGNAKMGVFYAQALDFSLANADLLRDDRTFVRLAASAALAIGPSGYVQGLTSLWRVFTSFRDSSVRTSVLKSLAVLGKGDTQITENLNSFLSVQNKLQRSSLDVDYDTVYSCVDVLGVLADGSSYAPLFSAMTAGYPDRIAVKAADSLHLLKGDYKRFLIDTIRKNPIADKAAAYRAGMDNAGFSPSERGELSEAALSVALSYAPSDPAEAEISAELRYSAVRTLTSLRWVRAADDGIKNFYIVQIDYGKGDAAKDRFLESIAFLGALSNPEAAQALSLQLGLINADMERSQTFDRDILLAVIDALGALGDKVAFDYLLYIGYLDYPDEIKTAAREALNRLTW